ncbi:helicase C-terminal domain-containing protein [Noviherbaspirillum agri]
MLTSATIATLGEFGPTLASLGLPQDTTTAKLSSPLDYSRARLIVPRLIVEANSKGHASMVTSILRAHSFTGDHMGTLVYFTSRKKMESVYASLTDEEKSIVIMQGALAPSAMIAEHKRRVDAGARSILFGLDSTAEGVDLPGKYCTLVFVDKLPFPSPDDPILASHSEHLESKGLHPFPLLMLPKAGLKLAQVVGRLIRTEADWGDVWILDRRLVEKKYGQRLIKSTPFASVMQV